MKFSNHEGRLVPPMKGEEREAAEKILWPRANRAGWSREGLVETLRIFGATGTADALNMPSSEFDDLLEKEMTK